MRHALNRHTPGLRRKGIRAVPSLMADTQGFVPCVRSVLGPAIRRRFEIGNPQTSASSRVTDVAECASICERSIHFNDPADRQPELPRSPVDQGGHEAAFGGFLPCSMIRTGLVIR